MKPSQLFAPLLIATLLSIALSQASNPPCPVGQYSSSGTCVSSCSNGTFINTTTNNCDSCDPSCSSCSVSKFNCTLCAPNYLFSSIPAPAPCTSSCPAGNFISSTINACIACNINCLTCNGPTESQCLSCASGNFLIVSDFITNAGICVQSCPTPIFYTNGSNCIASPYTTSSTNCSIGEYNSNGTCYNSCPPGTYTNGDTQCSQCDFSCSNCDSNSDTPSTTCLQCQYGFYELTSDEETDFTCIPPSQCALGTYPDPLSGTCLYCADNCNACFDSVNCYSCEDDYLNSFGNCIDSCSSDQYYDTYVSGCQPCFSSCNSCSGPLPTNCSGCYDGFTFDDLTNSCSPQTSSNCGFDQYWTGSTCQACDPSCEGCNDSGSNNCISCGVGFFLSEDDDYSCVLTCPNTTTPNNVTKYCDPLDSEWSECQNPNVPDASCYDDHCCSCSDSKRDGCNQCITGFFLADDSYCVTDCPVGTYASYDDLSCEDCNSECLTCTNSQGCLSCSDTYWYIPVTQQCSQGCPTGFYGDQFNQECYPCSSGCLACNSSSICTICQDGSYLFGTNCYTGCPTGYYMEFSNNTCLACSTSPCAGCSGSPTNCTSCPTGSYLSNNSCVSNTSCSTGYFANNLTNQCEPCNYLCASCSGSASSCLTCIQNATSSNGTCTTTCASGSYLNSTGSCQTCQKNCLECTPTGCTACNSTSFLNPFTLSCDTACPDGTYTNGSGCQLCDPSCTTCNGSSPINCTSCQSSWNATSKLYYFDNSLQSVYANLLFTYNGTVGAFVGQSSLALNNGTAGTGICTNQSLLGFYPNSLNASYSQCSPNCLACEGPFEDDCLSCNFGYFLWDGECGLACPGTLVENYGTGACSCPSGCASCSIVSSGDLICSSCVDNLQFTYQDHCTSTCPTAQIDNSGNWTYIFADSLTQQCTILCSDNQYGDVHSGNCVPNCNSVTVSYVNDFYRNLCSQDCPLGEAPTNPVLNKIGQSIYQCGTCAYGCIDCVGTSPSQCLTCSSSWHVPLNTGGYCYVSVTCPAGSYDILSLTQALTAGYADNLLAALNEPANLQNNNFEYQFLDAAEVFYGSSYYLSGTSSAVINLIQNTLISSTSTVAEIENITVATVTMLESVPLRFFHNQYGLNFAVIQDSVSFGSSRIANQFDSPIFGGANEGTWRLLWQPPQNNTNLFNNDPLSIRKYQSDLLSNIFTVLYSPYTASSWINSECFPCHYGCQQCATGFFYIPSNSTCTLQCPVGSNISVYDATNNSYITTFAVYDVNSLSQALNASNMTNWTAYNYTCNTTTNLVAIALTPTVINYTLGTNVFLQDKVNFTATNYDNFSWSLSDTNNTLPFYTYGYLTYGAGQSLDLSLSIPGYAFYDAAFGSYNFTLTLTQASTNTTTSIVFTFNFQPANFTNGTIAISPSNGSEYSTTFSINITGFSLNSTMGPLLLSYAVYAYPTLGACAWNSTLNASNGNCNLGSLPLAPNNNSNSTLTAYSVMSKFSDSTLGFVSNTISLAAVDTTMVQTTLAPFNFEIFDTRIPTNSTINYTIEVIIFNPNFPQYFYDQQIQVTVSGMSLGQLSSSLLNWYTITDPVSFNYAAQYFVYQFNQNYSSTIQTLIMSGSSTSDKYGASTSLGYSNEANYIIYSSNNIATILEMNQTCNSTIDCNGNGICSTLNNNITCLCNPGFAGSTCEYTYQTYFVLQNQLTKALYQLNQIGSSNVLVSLQTLSILSSLQLADLQSTTTLNYLVQNLRTLSNAAAAPSNDYYQNLFSTINNVLTTLTANINAIVNTQTATTYAIFQSAIFALRDITEFSSASQSYTYSTNLVTATIQPIQGVTTSNRRLQSSPAPAGPPQTYLTVPSTFAQAYPNLTLSAVILSFVSNPLRRLQTSNITVITQSVFIDYLDLNSNSILSTTVVAQNITNSTAPTLAIPKLISTQNFQFTSGSQPFVCLFWQSGTVNVSSGTPVWTGGATNWVLNVSNFVSSNETHVTCTAPLRGFYAAQLNMSDVINPGTPASSGNNTNNNNTNGTKHASNLAFTFGGFVLAILYQLV